MLMLRKVKLFFSVSFVSLLAGLSCHAATFTWDNGGSNSHWGNLSNWNPNQVPTSADEARFTFQDSGTVLVTGAPIRTVQSLSVFGSSSSPAEAELDLAGNILQVLNDVQLGVAWAQSSIKNWIEFNNISCCAQTTSIWSLRVWGTVDILPSDMT